jgi:hypothetical protein
VLDMADRLIGGAFTGAKRVKENALLAAILADGTNLGLARMADAS